MSQLNSFNSDLEQSNMAEDSLLNGKTGASLEANNQDGLEFSFNFAENVPQEVRDGIQEASQVWSSLIANDVSVKIDVGFEPQADTDTLADADYNSVEVDYGEFRQALKDSATSDNDAIAVANLPQGDSFNVLINNTSENQGSDEAYLDDNDSQNNSTIQITPATAKVLGLDSGGEATDATITFDDTVNWDFDPSDGIAEGAYDFQSVAIHEIGHTLGFDSTSDGLDTTAGQNLRELIASGDADLTDIVEALDLESLVAEFGLEEAIANADLEELIAGSPIEPILETIQPDQFVSEDAYAPSSQDLFRYSDSSSDLGVIDLTTGKEEKYFSLDGGKTEIAQFSTGEFLGDGEQASHWKDSLGIGIMDPTFAPGEIGNVSDTDLQLLDASGWTLI
ncbi:MAG: hypothetical protein RLZZ04_1703 [Cyanobacteriota bacterium]|jgi:hypothetical protein